MIYVTFEISIPDLNQLTSKNRLAKPLEEIDIKYSAKHSLHNADLAAQPQREQHQEEYYRPKWSWSEFQNCLSEYDKG